MIHNLVDVDDSIPVLRKKVIQFQDFVYLLFIFTEMNIAINVKKEPESKILKRWSPIQAKIKLTLDDYKRITKKFRNIGTPQRRR